MILAVSCRDASVGLKPFTKAWTFAQRLGIAPLLLLDRRARNANTKEVAYRSSAPIGGQHGPK